MSTFKVDSINGVAQSGQVHQRQGNQQEKAPVPSQVNPSHSGDMSHLLHIVKSNPEHVLSKQRMEQLRHDLSHDLYKPDIENLIHQITDSLLSKGII